MESIISWNFTNWLTVVLMAAVGFVVITFVAQGFHRVGGPSDALG